MDSGTIKIGVSTTICKHILMPYLEKFHEKYPKINIQINNNLSNNLLKELRNGTLDIVIMFSPGNSIKDIKTIPILEVQDIFVGNKKYASLTDKKIELNVLNSHPLILPNISSSSRKHLNNYLNTNKFNITSNLEVVSYSLIVDLIKAGFGIGYVTKEFILDELKNKTLFEIQVKPSIPKRTIVIATIDKKEPNYSSKKLIEMITNKL